MKRIDDLPPVAVAVKPLSEEPVAAPRGKRGKQPGTGEKPAANGRFVAGPAPSFDLSSGQQPTREQIRERAYFIYLARNGAAGDSQADWLQAERELIAERVKAPARRSSAS